MTRALVVFGWHGQVLLPVVQGVISGAIMLVENGLILRGIRSLPEVLAPLGDELAGCFWLIDVQLGVIRQWWPFETDEQNDQWEAQWDRRRWRVPAFERTSTCGFRPGTLPQFASEIGLDEWSYYIALDAPEAEALNRATKLAAAGSYLEEPVLRNLDDFADLLICHVDGWWEFYTGRREWYEKLRAAWPDVVERAVSAAGQPPSR